MLLKAVLNGMLDSNCYILGDGGEAAVIDPGADTKDIVRVISDQDLKLKYIILTHAHIDHIAQADELKGSLGGKTVIHEDDAPLLGDGRLNCSAFFGMNKHYDMADVLVRDGDVLELGKARLSVIHTPGHTPGGICILVSGAKAGGGAPDVMSGTSGDEYGAGNERSCIFTGDTLFRMSIGRTDLGAGDLNKLQGSLRRLMELDGSVQVYPGHGPATYIGYEKDNNPWI